MINKSCKTMPLASSKYCQLSVCKQCGVINLILPGRITMQFELQQFRIFAQTLNQAIQVLKTEYIAPDALERTRLN